MVYIETGFVAINRGGGYDPFASYHGPTITVNGKILVQIISESRKALRVFNPEMVKAVKTARKQRLREAPRLRTLTSGISFAATPSTDRRSARVRQRFHNCQFFALVCDGGRQEQPTPLAQSRRMHSHGKPEDPQASEAESTASPRVVQGKRRLIDEIDREVEVPGQQNKRHIQATARISNKPRHRLRISDARAMHLSSGNQKHRRTNGQICIWRFCQTGKFAYANFAKQENLHMLILPFGIISKCEFWGL